jgi:signal transduction histidine kinase
VRRVGKPLIDAVSRLPFRVQTKLLAAFLAIVVLLIALGAVGLQVLDSVGGQTAKLIQLERKIAAYRQVQQDTLSQLYRVSSALLVNDDRSIDSALRQLNDFGYDIERLQFVAKNEIKLLARVQRNYDAFVAVVKKLVDQIRHGQIEAARATQHNDAQPLANTLERLTNELVNKAEADMVAGIDATEAASRAARMWVILFAIGSTALALLLGRTISWSVVGPLRQIEGRLGRIAAGDFAEHVVVPNRDELGALAANLNRTSEQLGELYRELAEARDRAEAAYRDLQAAQSSLVQAQKMAALGQLTAGIAHEIKNPLNFVNNFAALSSELLDEIREELAPVVAALRGDKREAVGEAFEMLTGNLDKIVEHGRRADNIVKNMLEHSRGGSGERRSVDLNELVEEALNLAYHGARAQDQSFNITLERDYAPALAPVELAPQEMTRVLLNLFSNGFYAASRRAKANADAAYRPILSVTTRRADGAVEIAVRDNGTGISPGIRDKMFQPFFTTKPTGEGTGLGLSISYDIVAQQHGGTIEVASEEGTYAEFTIRLPIVNKAQQRREPRRVPAPT